MTDVHLLDKLSSLAVSLVFSSGQQEVSMLLIWGFAQSGFFPEIWGEISISGTNGIEGSLDGVSHSLGVSFGRGEDILNSGVLQDLLWSS